MSYVTKENKNKRKSPIKSILFLIGVGLLINSLITVLNLKITQEKRLSKLKEEVETLREENSKIKDEIAYRQTDAYLEKVAREKLRMTKEGEEIIIIPNNDSAVLGSQNKIEEKGFFLGLWEKIKYVFKKNRNSPQE